MWIFTSDKFLSISDIGDPTGTTLLVRAKSKVTLNACSPMLKSPRAEVRIIDSAPGSTGRKMRKQWQMQFAALNIRTTSKNAKTGSSLAIKHL